MVFRSWLCYEDTTNFYRSVFSPFILHNISLGLLGLGNCVFFVSLDHFCPFGRLRFWRFVSSCCWFYLANRWHDFLFCSGLFEGWSRGRRGGSAIGVKIALCFIHTARYIWYLKWLDGYSKVCKYVATCHGLFNGLRIICKWA